MPDPILTWTRTRPGEWHSGCGRYLILRGYLPGGMTVFNLRGLDHGCGPGGYFITERYGIGEIMQAAGTHAYAAEHGAERNVPPDFPALAMTRFFWPISGGTTRAALVITQAGGRTVARVVGMCRGDDAYQPGVYAEIDLTALTEGTPCLTQDR
jgi:hypothetical protein